MEEVGDHRRPHIRGDRRTVLDHRRAHDHGDGLPVARDRHRVRCASPDDPRQACAGAAQRDFHVPIVSPWMVPSRRTVVTSPSDVVTPPISGASVQVFTLSSWGCTVAESESESEPKLRVAFACRSVPPSGGRRRPVPPEPPKRSRWRSVAYGAILPMVVASLSFSAAPAAMSAPCPDGSWTCAPQPTQGTQPTQGNSGPTTAPQAP